jgi:ubiquinone/menaquinone biosynthesis C-methylase UbiE
LHLQCHFGQDTLSMSRMGAQTTGVDLSDKAIDAARKLNQEINQQATFICCNIYDLPQHLDQQFDIVFTSYGTIGWLPDLNQWAALIARYLKPGGKFVFAEFHPVVWMFDNDLKKCNTVISNLNPLLKPKTERMPIVMRLLYKHLFHGIMGWPKC